LARVAVATQMTDEAVWLQLVALLGMACATPVMVMRPAGAALSVKSKPPESEPGVYSTTNCCPAALSTPCAFGIDSAWAVGGLLTVTWVAALAAR